MAKFFITAPRFIRLKGKADPEYIVAAPDRPVQVELDDDFVPSERDFTIKREKPGKPKPAHSEKQRNKVRKSHEARLSKDAEGSGEGDEQ